MLETYEPHCFHWSICMEPIACDICENCVSHCRCNEDEGDE